MTIRRPLVSHTVWDRVVCALDHSSASISAAQVAARLMPPSASLTICTVLSPDANTQEAHAIDETERDIRDSLDTAQREIEALHDAELHLREGPPIQRILDELHTEQATLVTLGASARGPAATLKLRSIATAILHDAPCSVLIAHDDLADDGDVVVGFDGSGAARRALAASPSSPGASRSACGS